MEKVENTKGKIILYKASDGNLAIDVKLEEETVWLTQKQMSLLFPKDVRTINEHIKNVFQECELEKEPTIRKFRITEILNRANFITIRQISRIFNR